MKTTILTIGAAVMTALTVFGAPAEAGGKGVRINFGHSLGTFVARPTRGYVAKKNSHHAYKAAARRAKIAKIRKAKIAAARKAKIAQIRKAKIAAAKKAKIAAAKKRRIAALNATARKRAKARRQEEKEARKAEEAERVKAEEVAGVEEIAPATKMVSDTNNESTEAELPEVIVEDDTAEDNVAQVSSIDPPTPEASIERAITCKKFVPSAGMTITVPCKN